MAEYEGDGSRNAPVPDEGYGPAATPPASSPAAADLAAALGGLDRATRNFTRRLGEGQREVERARLAGERAIREAALAETAGPEPEAAVAPEAAVTPENAVAPEAAVADAGADAARTFDRRFREADLEARAYLESAKRRADSLVASMVGAVEYEAAQARREAEEAIRARWKQVEVDATRHVENARRVAARMVSERQQRIAKLSDGISDRATALTAGMDDADRVRAQFDAFIRALAVTADQIAREPTGQRQAGQVRDLHGHSQPSAIAA